MTRPLLQGRSLKKDYGRIPVLKGIDIDVAEGEAHVVIGPNGAGKTTLFKVLSGEVPPTGGSVQLAGKDVTELDGWRRARLGIGRTFQTARIFKEMSTADNLIVAIEAKRRWDASPLELLRLAPVVSVRDAAHQILSEFSLEGVAHRSAGSLSHGDKKALELAMVISARPRLLMLDEPTAGMAPADRQRSVEMIARLLKKDGLSILLTEHDMDVVFGLATRISVLNYGELIASGSPEEVRSNPRVREVYLGHDVAAA